MPRVKLDHNYCLTASCTPGKRRTDYYDVSTTGFTLAVHQSGTKSYEFRYQDAYGKLKQRRIAPYGDITFAEAQKIAKRWRAEVITGGDPAAQKAEKKATITYAELAKQHLDYAKTYQKRPGNTDAVMRVHLLPRWGARRLDEITAQAIATWLGELREGLAPATVEKIRITFNRSFELGLKWGCAKSNPVRGIPRPKFSNQRSRYLSPAEAQRLLRAVERSANPSLAAIVHLLLLTGARKNELLRARWEHVDLRTRDWLIPDSKTGKSRHVPLSQAAVDVIGGLSRLNEWLLPNPSTRKPYTDIKRAWMTARDEAHLPDLRIHDLRHSFASFAVNAGVDLYQVGAILGHSDHQSTARYSHCAPETLMRAVEAGAAKMSGSHF